MELYRELYFYLFAQTAQAVEEIEAGKVILAVNRLTAAQREAERRVIEQDIPGD